MTRSLTLTVCLAVAALMGCQQQQTEVVKTTYPAADAAPKAAEAPAKPAVAPMALTIDGSPSMGAEVAKVTIVESSDFQ
ncbi:MAG: hypothetical protein QF464_07605 [Myxococcota bacterium]|nr:hypothetical protein [Myxococcota bacterium]